MKTPIEVRKEDILMTSSFQGRRENTLVGHSISWRTRVWPDLGENIRTSISCPFSCAFCGFPEHAGKYQTVNVELIERELKSVDRMESVKSVYFIDDTFNVPVKRFKEILRMMIRNRFKFRSDVCR